MLAAARRRTGISDHQNAQPSATIPGSFDGRCRRLGHLSRRPDIFGTAPRACQLVSHDDVVLDRTVGPPGVPSKREDSLRLEPPAGLRREGIRGARNVNIGRVENDMGVADQPVIRNDAGAGQIREDTPKQFGSIDYCIARPRYLDVEAHPRLAEDVVVMADAKKHPLRLRVIDPVVRPSGWAVEAEVEDEHLVGGKYSRWCDLTDELENSGQRGGYDHPIECEPLIADIGLAPVEIDTRAGGSRTDHT